MPGVAIGGPSSLSHTLWGLISETLILISHIVDLVYPYSLKDYLYICSLPTTIHMYVVHEKAFQYSIILSLKVPSKRDLINIHKKEKLKYDIKNLDETIKGIKNPNGAHARTIMVLDPGITLITFYKWNNDAFDYGSLAHEIFHAVDMNLRSKGIVLSDDSDETYAYHLGYFIREFLQELWKPKK